jgi:hypothetical protein
LENKILRMAKMFFRRKTMNKFSVPFKDSKIFWTFLACLVIFSFNLLAHDAGQIIHPETYDHQSQSLDHGTAGKYPFKTLSDPTEIDQKRLQKHRQEDWATPIVDSDFVGQRKDHYKNLELHKKSKRERDSSQAFVPEQHPYDLQWDHQYGSGKNPEKYQGQETISENAKRSHFQSSLFREDKFRTEAYQESAVNEADFDTKKISLLGTDSWTFSFLKDSLSIGSKTDSFKRTFRQDHKFFSRGAFQITQQYKMSQNAPFFLGYEANLALHYNRGYAFYSQTQERSQSRFYLWFVPFDLGLYTGINFFEYLSFGGSLGGTSMLISQSRDDFRDDDPQKRLRDFAFGYYCQGTLSISLSKFFSQYSREIFVNNNIYNLSLTGVYKYQQILKVVKNTGLKVSLQAVGFGVSFAFL